MSCYAPRDIQEISRKSESQAAVRLYVSVLERIRRHTFGYAPFNLGGDWWLEKSGEISKDQIVDLAQSLEGAKPKAVLQKLREEGCKLARWGTGVYYLFLILTLYLLALAAGLLTMNPPDWAQPLANWNEYTPLVPDWLEKAGKTLVTQPWLSAPAIVLLLSLWWWRARHRIALKDLCARSWHEALFEYREYIRKKKQEKDEKEEHEEKEKRKKKYDALLKKDEEDKRKKDEEDKLRTEGKALVDNEKDAELKEKFEALRKKEKEDKRKKDEEDILRTKGKALLDKELKKEVEALLEKEKEVEEKKRKYYDLLKEAELKKEEEDKLRTEGVALDKKEKEAE